MASSKRTNKTIAKRCIRAMLSSKLRQCTDYESLPYRDKTIGRSCRRNYGAGNIY